jgi:hypothetical protein
MAYSRPGVYVTERLLPAPITGGVTANAAGAVVAPLAKGPEAVTRVTSWSEFTKYFGGYNAAYPATFGIGTYFSNGGRELFVKRVMHTDASAATVNLLTSGSTSVATITAKNRGADGTNLRVALTTGTVSSTYTLTVYQEGGASTSSADITNDILLERYENIVFDAPTSSSFAETVINTVSTNIVVSASASGTPVTTVYPLVAAVGAVNSGDGSTVVASDYTAYNGGSTSVFEEFTSLNRALVIFLPNIYTTLAGTGVTDVYSQAVSWAQSNQGFVIIETDKNQTVAQALTTAGTAGYVSSNAAVYYPQLYITDPVGRSSSSLRLIGPSGAVAGLFMTTDATRGVFKAPAGLTATILGAVQTEKVFSSAELDSLNSGSHPVNPIRQIPGAGLAVMGARTLLQDGTANKYVNMRRSLIYIEKSLKSLTEFAVFENNDERLWARLNGAIGSFLNDYRNQGGLRGATAAQAYYVVCDGSNNTATTIANGEVHIQVGVALQYPAEFIVLDLSQKTLN